MQQAGLDSRAAAYTDRLVHGVEDLAEKVRGASVTATQLSAGTCEGRLFHAELADAAVSVGGFGGDIRIRGEMAPGEVTLATILEQQVPVCEWGGEVAAGDLLVFPPGGEQEGRYRGPTRYAAVMITPEALARRAADHELEPAPLLSPGVRAVSPGGAERLRTRVRLRTTALMSGIETMAPAARALLANELIDLFLEAAAEASAPQTSASQLNGAHVIRRAEDYLAARKHELVQVEDLCRDLGVSRRTLHRAFEQTLGVGPRSYLRLMNLSAARAALTAPASESVSVTQVALDHGFWELGRFSVAYRQMFGESPSQTLRRRAS